MKKIFFSFLASILLLTQLVHAHCPLCTAAVGAAAVSAKYYGMDLTLIGLLIGAFGISTGLWIGLKIKKQFIKGQLAIITIASFLLTVLPLLYISNDSIHFSVLLFGEPGSLFNKVYWINKILFGSIIGGIATAFAYILHIKIKKVNGKVLFPFQGIAITLLSLLISGLALYFAFGA